jgi:uncharacterized HAD superfamily protein
MRIGLDLDGVVVDSIGRWIEVLNRHAGTAYQPGDLPETYGTPELAAVSDRHELEMLIAPGPMAGAVGALRRLSAQGHRLIVITARAPRLRRLTEAWLDYYGIAVDRMHFLEGGSKVQVALEERVEVMVEDAPKNALALAEGGVPVLLFGAPYNRDVRHPLIHRCDGWGEAERLLGGWQRPEGWHPSAAS